MPAIPDVYPDVARLPPVPTDHGLVQMVNAYSLHGCVVVVVAAADAPSVPADKAGTVRAALAYVLAALAQRVDVCMLLGSPGREAVPDWPAVSISPLA